MSQLGDDLRVAREQRGLTIDDVSRITRIKPKFLEALEHGEYGLLPGQAYVTGFLRNYASVLGLHPDEVVEEYHAIRPARVPTVKPATRVLASGHNRQHRSRLFWSMAGVFLLLGGGFAVKEYNDTYAHPYSAPNITPPNLGMSSGSASAQPPARHRQAHRIIHLQLQASQRVWIRVVVDKRRVFQGLIRPGSSPLNLRAQRAIYVLTYHGPRVNVVFNGQRLGPMSQHPGPVVEEATSSGLTRVV